MCQNPVATTSFPMPSLPKVLKVLRKERSVANIEGGKSIKCPDFLLAGCLVLNYIKYFEKQNLMQFRKLVNLFKVF